MRLPESPVCREISIHVPAWGTTFSIYSISSISRISIHVPAWGTTYLPTFHLQFYIYFDPRSRVGNDAIALIPPIMPLISIHVPAWGTTLPDCHSPHCQPFQSTFPRGERRQSKAIIRWLVYFNPRSRVGNDLQSANLFQSPSNFNPRSRVGNDAILLRML